MQAARGRCARSDPTDGQPAYACVCISTHACVGVCIIIIIIIIIIWMLRENLFISYTRAIDVYTRAIDVHTRYTNGQFMPTCTCTCMRICIRTQRQALCIHAHECTHLLVSIMIHEICGIHTPHTNQSHAQIRLHYLSILVDENQGVGHVAVAQVHHTEPYPAAHLVLHF